MKITKLLKGYVTYRESFYPTHAELLKNLAEHGQHPKVAVIACCDSRVNPAMLTDSKPGDLFVIRNIASLVPPYVAADKSNWQGTIAAVEYAVFGLAVEHIVVLGHAQCGGINALLAESGVAKECEYVQSWMKIAAEAKQTALGSCCDSPEEQAKVAEQAAVKISLKNLMTFPWVQERVEQGTLELHGWYYNLASATLTTYDEQSDEFQAVKV
ncbi:Carbonic anhydrase, beta class [hydrothermal vent metagenome]|uniref:carbonic anhydrase n=1 Tax=hydrothermal vent metagenome TaxID=652676 RepID=A0A3B1B8B0_9ZZZZ